MLRPGGFLLTNNLLLELPSLKMKSVDDVSVEYSSRESDGDQIVWYGARALAQGSWFRMRSAGQRTTFAFEVAQFSAEPLEHRATRICPRKSLHLHEGSFACPASGKCRQAEMHRRVALREVTRLFEPDPCFPAAGSYCNSSAPVEVAASHAPGSSRRLSFREAPPCLIHGPQHKGVPATYEPGDRKRDPPGLPGLLLLSIVALPLSFN